jgi:hypothetical protein
MSRSVFVCIRLTFLVVYPETKGVPLEEMDAVFGEGQPKHASRYHNDPNEIL